jgi:hypothetical protein
MPYIVFAQNFARRSGNFSLAGTLPDDPGSSGMSGDPQECREHAKEYLKQARSAPTLLVMTKFENLAHSWLRLAEELERAEALRERLKAPERKAS